MIFFFTTGWPKGNTFPNTLYESELCRDPLNIISISELRVQNGDDKKPWYMRETGDLPSLAMQSRTDSGIGEELWRTSRSQFRPKTGPGGLGEKNQKSQ